MTALSLNLPDGTSPTARRLCPLPPQLSERIIMTLELPKLPFPIDALAPHMSRETLEFHHGKHHKAYVDKANALLEGKDLASKPLPEIIRAAAKSGDKPLFNNTA